MDLKDVKGVKDVKKLLCLSLAVAGLSVEALAAQQSIYQRQTTAQAAIAGSRGLYDGAFGRAAPAMICGEIPKEASLTGEATFVIEFPDAPPPSTPGAIASIAFDSKQLVGGAAKASAFRLSIGVVTAKGGRPPAYVLNTDPAGTKNTGTATLTTQGGSTTLKVVGQNDAGETIDLTVTCGSPPGRDERSMVSP